MPTLSILILGSKTQKQHTIFYKAPTTKTAVQLINTEKQKTAVKLIITKKQPKQLFNLIVTLYIVSYMTLTACIVFLSETMLT